MLIKLGIHYIHEKFWNQSFLLLEKLPLQSSEELMTPSRLVILIVVSSNVLYITKDEIEAGYKIRTYFAFDFPV